MTDARRSDLVVTLRIKCCAQPNELTNQMSLLGGRASSTSYSNSVMSIGSIAHALHATHLWTGGSAISNGAAWSCPVLSFREFSTPCLTARREQRCRSFFNARALRLTADLVAENDQYCASSSDHSAARGIMARERTRHLEMPLYAMRYPWLGFEEDRRMLGDALDESNLSITAHYTTLANEQAKNNEAGWRTRGSLSGGRTKRYCRGGCWLFCPTRA
jgi:hypothetical protein